MAVDFHTLQDRLLCRIRDRVRNGEITERGLARLVGISQPHIHKVLRGTRTLSTENFDQILSCVNFSLLDLCTRAEIQEHSDRSGFGVSTYNPLPCLAAPVGPGLAWTETLFSGEPPVYPSSVTYPEGDWVVARLGTDPSMRFSGASYEIALIDRRIWDPFASPESIYVVDRAADAVLRRVRQGSKRVYLISDRNADQPSQWEVLTTGKASLGSAIRGRVAYFGRVTSGKAPHQAIGYSFDEATAV